jgi:dTDP-4-amino-4,6-dideoxygalactose transaminase
MIQLEKQAVLANDFKRLWAEIGTDVLAAVADVGESGWYILGERVKLFEARLAQIWSLPHAIGVANGLDAIEISLRVLGLKPGDKVLTTPLSAFATTLAILRAGGIPVFVDIDATGQLDLALAEQAIQIHSIQFMVPVHLYGQPLNLSELERLKTQYKLAIVEDCAQAIGAHWNGKPVGSVGQMATTSFYPTKNLGAMGDGGAILTSDEALALEASYYRDYGQKAKYIHSHQGLNSRLDEVQAAILEKAMLPHLNAWAKRRQDIAKQYIEKLKSPHLHLPNFPAAEDSAWHLFPVFARTEAQRDDLMAFLKTQKIGVAVHYPLLIPEQPVMTEEVFITEGQLTLAEQFARTEVSLPIHPYLTNGEVLTVIEACNAWVPTDA